MCREQLDSLRTQVDNETRRSVRPTQDRSTRTPSTHPYARPDAAATPSAGPAAPVNGAFSSFAFAGEMTWSVGVRSRYQELTTQLHLHLQLHLRLRLARHSLSAYGTTALMRTWIPPSPRSLSTPLSDRLVQPQTRISHPVSRPPCRRWTLDRSCLDLLLLKQDSDSVPGLGLGLGPAECRSWRLSTLVAMLPNIR